MTAKQWIALVAWITVLILVVIGTLNFLIDGTSSHSIPEMGGLFPRTTKPSALSKLHYLSTQRPAVIYFGSSRVEVGLPATTSALGGRSAYNAGLSGSPFVHVALVVRHALAITRPETIVLGLDFPSFTSHAGSSDLDTALIASSRTEYFLRRIPADARLALSLDESWSSAKSVMALSNGAAYDQDQGMDIRMSVLGQLTERYMEKLTMNRGAAAKAFRVKIRSAFRPPPAPAETAGALKMLDELLAVACRQQVTVRVFIHPVHALAEDAVRVGNAWDRLEQWKIDLARLATKHGSGCDLRIVDFSGYNSITTETIGGLGPRAPLRNYWEASHYKSAVGEMILERLLSSVPGGVPADFGRELREETVADVNVSVQEEQLRYLASHAREVAESEAWVNGNDDP